MNKTYINILCVLILGILAVNVSIPFMTFGNSMSGEMFNHEMTETHVPFFAQFTNKPDVRWAPSGELTFDSGEKYSIISQIFNIFIPKEDIPACVKRTIVSSNIFSALFMLIALYQFIRFVININRSRIFISENVKRLQYFGLLLLAVAICDIVSGSAETYMINSLNLIYCDRLVRSVWDFPWTSLLIGLTALLMARTWANGLKLREDQELTI